MGQVGIIFISDSLEDAASDIAKFIVTAQQKSARRAEGQTTAAPTPGQPIVPLEELSRLGLIGEDADTAEPEKTGERQRRGSNFRRQGGAPTAKSGIQKPEPPPTDKVEEFEQARAEAREFGETYGGHELRAVLQRFGVVKVSALKPEHYATFRERLQETAHRLETEKGAE